MFLILSVFMLLLFFPQITHDGIKNGLILLENQVIPSLYPFILLSVYLRKKGCNTTSPILILSSFLSGYPVGAKIVSENDFHISELSSQQLLLLCNMPSPSYLFSYVGYHCLKQPKFSFFIFISILIGNTSTLASQKIIQKICFHNKPSASYSDLHCLSINNSMDASTSFSLPQEAFFTLLTISTYILIFNIVAAFIQQIPFLHCLSKNLLVGLFEITTGIKQLSETPLNLNLKLTFITGLLSFGGFSIILQTNSMIQSSKLSIKKYMTDKAISSCIAMTVMYGFTFLIK